MDLTRSMIDPLVDRQFKYVFDQYDEDNLETLTWDQFQDFAYAIGFQFLITHYKKDVEFEIFKGNFEGNRAEYKDFKTFVDNMCMFEED